MLTCVRLLARRTRCCLLVALCMPDHSLAQVTPAFAVGTILILLPSLPVARRC